MDRVWQFFGMTILIFLFGAHSKFHNPMITPSVILVMAGKRKITKNFAHANGGCACKTLRLAPHRHERKLSAACVCRVTFKDLSQPFRSHIRLSEIPPFVRPNIALCRGESPICFRVWNPHIFVTQGLMPSSGTLGQVLKLLPFPPKHPMVRGGVHK